MRSTFSCPMEFWALPYDAHRCPVMLELYYGSKADVSSIQWRGSADGQQTPLEIDDPDSVHWVHCVGTHNSSVVSLSTGSFSVASVDIVLRRKSVAQTMSSVVISTTFILASYSGFYISPAAAPARVALGFLCFLMVLNNLNDVRKILPHGLDPFQSWLLLWMYCCLTFNFMALLEYALVNYGMAVDSENRAKAVESAPQCTPDKLVRIGEVRVRTVPEKPSADLSLSAGHIISFCEGKLCYNHATVANCKDLDLVCRWLFPLSFLMVMVVLLLLLHLDPRTQISLDARGNCVVP